MAFISSTTSAAIPFVVNCFIANIISYLSSLLTLTSIVDDISETSKSKSISVTIKESITELETRLLMMDRELLQYQVEAEHLVPLFLIMTMVNYLMERIVEFLSSHPLLMFISL